MSVSKGFHSSSLDMMDVPNAITPWWTGKVMVFAKWDSVDIFLSLESGMMNDENRN